MSISIVRQWRGDNSRRQYLGIFFNSTLNGNAKISRIITKARRGLNTLKVMSIDRMPQRNMPLFFDMLVISQVDYGFRMLTLSNTHSVGIKGYTRNTPASVMWYELWLRAIKERHKVAHFKDYQRVWGDPQYPPHDTWTSDQDTTNARHRYDDQGSQKTFFLSSHIGY